MQTLRNWLELEHQDKKKKPFDFDSWEDYYSEVCCGQSLITLHVLFECSVPFVVIRRPHSKKTPMIVASLHASSWKEQAAEKMGSPLDSIRTICYISGVECSGRSVKCVWRAGKLLLWPELLSLICVIMCCTVLLLYTIERCQHQDIRQSPFTLARDHHL